VSIRQRILAAVGQAGARRNAMVASNALLRLRQERDEVDAFLALHQQWHRVTRAG
jgi:hypothetical protein